MIKKTFFSIVVFLCGTFCTAQSMDKEHYEKIVDYVNCKYQIVYCKNNFSKCNDKPFYKTVMSWEHLKLDDNIPSITEIEQIGFGDNHKKRIQIINNVKDINIDTLSYSSIIDTLLNTSFNDCKNSESVNIFCSNMRSELLEHFNISENTTTQKENDHEEKQEISANSSEDSDKKDGNNHHFFLYFIIVLLVLSLVLFVLFWKMRKSSKKTHSSSQVRVRKDSEKIKNPTNGLNGLNTQYKQLCIENNRLKTQYKQLCIENDKLRSDIERLTSIISRAADKTAQSLSVIATVPQVKIDEHNDDIHDSATLYADFINDNYFNKVTDKPTEDTVFELHIQKNNADFTIFPDATPRIIHNPAFLEGCEKQVIGNTSVEVKENGRAQIQPDGKWSIVKKLNVLVK